MSNPTNDEYAAFEAWLRKRWGGSNRGELTRQSNGAGYVNGNVDFAFAAYRADRAATPAPTEAAAMAATVPAGQLYFALNNLLTHLGLEGSIDADHGFVWDTMTALKRIDGGVYLDNLAVPTEPDAHRDDMLAVVRMLEDGEWAEHFAKTPIGKRLEDAVTKLHSDLNDAQPPVAGQPAEPSPADLQARIDDLEAERDEALRGPWPEWAEQMKKTIRKYSGYDGFDDASEGIDLPAELDELMEHLDLAPKGDSNG